MKRWIWILLPVVLLSGCKAETTLETVADEWLVPAMAQPREMTVRLPEDTVLPVLEQDGRQLYMGDGYELVLETRSSGDLEETIRQMCGFEKENLTVIRTRQEGEDRYDFVWTTVSEQGQQLGRGAVLDDGEYHYCLSVLRQDAPTSVVWQDVFSSFALCYEY